MEIFYKITIIRQLTKWNESIIENILSKTVGILQESLHVIVSVCVHVFVWLLVVYYRVCMCGWHIVYVKVQTQHVVFTKYKVVGVSYFYYITLYLYV